MSDEAWERTGYEAVILVNGQFEAGAESDDLADVVREGNHYAAIYAQDGPVELRFYEKAQRLITPPCAADAGRTSGLTQNG